MRIDIVIHRDEDDSGQRRQYEAAVVPSIGSAILLLERDGRQTEYIVDSVRYEQRWFPSYPAEIVPTLYVSREWA